MSAGGRQLFIYWRTPAVDAAPATLAVRRMQATLRLQHAGLQAALYRREPDAAAQAGSGAVTLMETYSKAGGVDAALQAEIAALATEQLGRWCRDGRHVEVFTALAG